MTSEKTGSHSTKEGGSDKSGIFSKSTVSTLTYFFIIVVAGLIIINQLQIGSVTAALAFGSGGTGSNAVSGPLDTTGWTADEKMNYEMHGVIPARLGGGNAGNKGTVQDPADSAELAKIIPTGVPAVYGSELGISYDDVSASNAAKANETIKKMSVYDTGITLSGDKLQRYIAITTNISCEYCCGAEAITFSDGKAACGCAHSGAMRGIAKYLLDKHADQFSNDQILEELGKWKVLYFPGNMLSKAKALEAKGIELNYINLGSNKYRGIENK